jgi:hypothetical protein
LGGRLKAWRRASVEFHFAERWPLQIARSSAFVGSRQPLMPGRQWAYRSLARPPHRRRIAGRDLSGAKRDRVAALVRKAANGRAILAAHIALKLVDRRGLRPADDVERDGLMDLAAEAPDLEKTIAGVERITERRNGCAGPLSSSMRYSRPHKRTYRLPSWPPLGAALRCGQEVP